MAPSESNNNGSSTRSSSILKKKKSLRRIELIIFILFVLLIELLLVIYVQSLIKKEIKQNYISKETFREFFRENLLIELHFSSEVRKAIKQVATEVDHYPFVFKKKVEYDNSFRKNLLDGFDSWDVKEKIREIIKLPILESNIIMEDKFKKFVNEKIFNRISAEKLVFDNQYLKKKDFGQSFLNELKKEKVRREIRILINQTENDTENYDNTTTEDIQISNSVPPKSNLSPETYLNPDDYLKRLLQYRNYWNVGGPILKDLQEEITKNKDKGR